MAKIIKELELGIELGKATFPSRPVLNRRNKKWVIEVGQKSQKVKIGTKDDTNTFYTVKEFISRESATKYIKNDDRLVLKDDSLGFINKIGRKK